MLATDDMGAGESVMKTSMTANCAAPEYDRKHGVENRILGESHTTIRRGRSGMRGSSNWRAFALLASFKKRIPSETQKNKYPQ